MFSETIITFQEIKATEEEYEKKFYKKIEARAFENRKNRIRLHLGFVEEDPMQ